MSRRFGFSILLATAAVAFVPGAGAFVIDGIVPAPSSTSPFGSTSGNLDLLKRGEIRFCYTVQVFQAVGGGTRSRTTTRQCEANEPTGNVVRYPAKG